MPDDIAIALSVIAPAHNEAENLRPLVAELDDVLAAADVDYEIIVVDDGSTDATARTLADLVAAYPRLRAFRLPAPRPGRPSGQSAALRAGLVRSRGAIIAMIDADLQNDPADLPAMLEMMRETGADLVQGDRTATRRDPLLRRASSSVGRMFRRTLLGDLVRDTGCSLRLLPRPLALRLPLGFDGMHRFIPVTVRDLGGFVIEVPVRHRPRRAGRTKYGIRNRAFRGLIDCLAVRWMRSRRRSTAVEPIAPRSLDAVTIEVLPREAPAREQAVR